MLLLNILQNINIGSENSRSITEYIYTMSSCTIWLSIIRKKSSDDVSRQKADAFESGNYQCM